MKAPADRKPGSKSQLLHNIFITACFSAKKRSKQE